jgi:chromosome segregation protein
MFKLQRLEITGFKSFADYTELVFTDNGITAIVGPNGCGKSNFADAIAWVLGEQRVKHLRGGEMKDVIFQGSRNRAPSGMAEVVLHMMRDDTVEEEPDIDDIDSTLQALDDKAEEIDERFGDETVADADAAIEAFATEASLVVTPEATPIEGIETVERSEAVTKSAYEETVATPDDTITASDGQAEAAEQRSRAHHKRHWRPRRLALDFAPGEMVSVARRLYRSGESEYLLNGRVCRLRDIQDLFSGTGLSGAHYAIIEQGRIGQILSAKPMDRRTLIEEAAGITKFRVRQRAAETRLEAARANLNRLSDIISEIERQVGSLRRQAAKARRYRQIREELRDLLRKVYAGEDRALTAQLGELEQKLSEANAGIDALATNLEEREDEGRRATSEARSREEELAEARAAVSDAALKRDRRERERVYQSEQAGAFEKRLEEVRREVEIVRARLTTVESESEALLINDVRMREESEETARQLEAAEQAYARRVAEAYDTELAIETARTELLTHTAVGERLREIGRQIESALERLAQQAEGLRLEGERAHAIHEQAREQAEKLEAEIAVARAHIDSLLTEREAAARSLTEARSQVAATAAEHARVRDEAARVKHRLETLAEIDSQRSLYSRAVQRIFSPADADPPQDFRAMGTLADVFRVEPHWERAIESALGTNLQAVIVPTPDDALRGAAWLEATGAGRATFVVAGLHGGSETDEADDYPFNAMVDEAFAIGEEVYVANLLGAPREIADVLHRTLARELSARVVENLEQAMILSLASSERCDACVTKAGEWVVAGQLISAGGPLMSEEGAGLLAFKREIRELEAGAVGLEADLLFANEAAARSRARLAELEDGFVLLNDAIGREEREHVARELNETQLQQEIDRAARHMKVVADDASRLEAERRELEERRERQQAEANAAEAGRVAAQTTLSEAAELLAAARRAAELENENLSQQRATAAAASERRRSAASELRRREAETDELRTRLARHESEVATLTTGLDELRASLTLLDESAGRVEDERVELDSAVESAARRLAEARERADSISTQLTELHQGAAEARDARAALEVQRAEAAARLNFLRESCLHELNQPLEELASELVVEEGFDLEVSKTRVEELRERVEGFGAVNMMALDELTEADERLTFLTAQRQDITDGMASTEEALREIKRRSRERFRHAFEEINRNFGTLFTELFGGGRGEMSLIDAEDVLESGIDIVAQPPGKRLQNVLLLSGGEKAMAALSLVLAIFRYNPSPFCLLDEVDAPLDEANVGRFTAKVTEMAADTQFLVITHNKRTMEVARALYGVTMEEVGISKLVSVRFE